MINVDADGFLVDWHGYVINNHFPQLTISQLNGLDPDERSRVLRDMYVRDPQLFYKLESLPGAVDFMSWLQTLGEPWRILTSAGTDHPDYDVAKASKIANLTKLFDIPESKIIVANTSAEKASYCDGSHCVLIDDFHKNIAQWNAAGGHGILVPENYDWIDIVVAVEEHLELTAL